MCEVDVQDQLCDNYTLKRRDHKCQHWIKFHVINTTIVDSYTMYKAHMTHLGKFTKTMSHLKFNVSLVKAFIKGHVGSTPKKHNDGESFYTQSWGATSFHAKDKNTKEKKVVCGV